MQADTGEILILVAESETDCLQRNSGNMIKVYNLFVAVNIERTIFLAQSLDSKKPICL